MKQLAIKSANETINDFQRESINQEYIELMENMDSIICKLRTECDDKPLFNKNNGILSLKINCDDIIYEIQLRVSYSFNIPDISYSNIIDQESAQNSIELLGEKLNDATRDLESNKNTLVQLKLLKKNKDISLKSKICQFIEFLQKRAEYYKCKGKNNFSNSKKNEIPSWLIS